MTQSAAFLHGRAEQVLADLVRHGWRTRAPYNVPAGRIPSAWHHARISGLRGAEAQALGQLARQDRIRLRALCAALRALRGLA